MLNSKGFTLLGGVGKRDGMIKSLFKTTEPRIKSSSLIVLPYICLPTSKLEFSVDESFT